MGGAHAEAADPEPNALPWLELHCLCSEDAAETFSDALLEAGALSVSVEDADAGAAVEQPIYGEPGCAPGRVWHRNRVVALLDAGADCGAVVETAAGASGIAAPTWTVHALAEADWVRLTQAQFDPVRISDRLWIVPSWHQAPDAAAVAIRLDPGLAFGTGSHPTTRLCLRWLDQAPLRDCEVLDYGCGSGILAIAAASLGARRVIATDIDPQALQACRENAEANRCAIEVREVGDLGGVHADIVIANILTNPLKVLAPALVGRLAPGGRLILSGILEEQEGDVITTYAPLLRMRAHAREDGWTCLTGALGT